MNILFWGFLILMLLLAIALLVFPLLKVRQYDTLAYKDSNLKINEEKFRELDADMKEGRIDQNSYKLAREELDRELLIDIPVESKDTAAQHYTSAAKRHPVMALAISVFVPMLALLLYLQLGMHAASEENFAASHQQQSTPAKQQPSIEVMIKQLEARIAEKGGSAEDWTMLARAHKYQGENEQAAKAFAVALESDANNAQLMLEAAEVIALSNNRIFNSESRALVLKAYSLEPDNANVLWFIGVAEYQQGNYRQAIKHLKKLLPQTGGEEDVVKSIVSIVAKSRQELILAGEDVPELEVLLGAPAFAESGAKAGAKESMATDLASSSPDSVTSSAARSATSPATRPATRPAASPAANAASKSSAAPAVKLTIDVDISAQVREKFSADDTVFVYAKAKQGPRMPLAAQRLTLSALPTTVTLDDSMAMVEGMNLSAFEQLQISARITKSGSAIARSGDYIGQIAVSNSDEEIIKIIINTVVP